MFRLLRLLTLRSGEVEVDKSDRKSIETRLPGPRAVKDHDQNCEAEEVTSEIITLYQSLSTIEKTQGLKPCEEVNRTFSKLVAFSSETRNEAVERSILEDERVLEIMGGLRRICAVGERLLEVEWAEKIISAVSEKEAKIRLRQFPYFQNYMDLTAMEISALHAAGCQRLRRIAFIGSGPLPLTSLCFLEAMRAMSPLSSRRILKLVSEAEVLNIDGSSQAFELSGDLCSKLGRKAEGMKFLHCEVGRDYPPSSTLDLRSFDVVYLAALVGSTVAEKERILVDVVGRMNEGAFVIVRSARGLRGLMYPIFDVSSKAVAQVLEICLVVHPYGDVFNSVVVGRVQKRRG